MLAAAPVACAIFSSSAEAQSAGNRLLGLDISAHQGIIAQTTWDDFSNVENRKFVLIRSSRGGTTGEDHRQGGYPAGNNTFFNLSQRYDDPYFVHNINAATNAGMYAGAYHRSRADVIATTLNSDGVTTAGVANNGTDEANHMMQMSGPWMRPGYLPPVLDFEDGIDQRTDTEMAQFALDFSNRIYQVMQIRPAIYINGNYAQNVLAGGTASQRNQMAQPSATPPSVVSPAFANLWNARWPAGSGQQYFGDVQNEHPKDTFANIYGPWDDYGTTHPWAFWQYASGGRLQSFNNGTQNLDFDVAQGGHEFVKDQLIPALWWNDSSGDWSTLANWNSGQTPTQPPQMPGQLAPTATEPLPTPRLPGAAGSGPTSGQNDTVILERPSANITVTMTTGTHDIRKLYMREALNITGGSLNINYVPVVPESSAMSAQISGPMTLGGTGSLSVHTMWVDSTRTLSLAGGTITFNTIDLKQAPALAGGSLAITGNVIVNPLSNATATIMSSAGPSGSGPAGLINLSGGTRALLVGNGTADVDLQVNVPITNGQLTKTGAGTMALGATNTFTGAITLNGGILRVSAPGQLNGASGVTSNITVSIPGSAGAGNGGTLQLTGNNTYNLPMTINGGGVNGISITPPGGTGALDSLSGNNTWSGTITLGGSGNNGTDPTINQVSAQAGATLVLSGVIQNQTLINASLAKSGAGDVVLTGGAANTYTNFTRVYGGRLIIEKNGALGAAGSDTLADGNTFQLGGTSNTSTIVFRAPGASPGFHYATYEWINLDGVGSGGLAQLDNLSGNNTFSGHIGLNGPSSVSSIGVSAGSLELKGGLFTRGASGTRTLNKTGVGTLIISGDTALTVPNTLNGSLVASTMNVNDGMVMLKGTAGNTANVPGITTYNVAATLALAKQGAAGSASITLNGGTLRADADSDHAGALTIGASGGTLDSAGSSATFSGGIFGSGHLKKNNLGFVTLANAVNGFSGAVTVNLGTLRVAPNGGNTGTLNMASLSVDPSAALDLSDNDFVVNNGSFSAIRNLVMSGFENTAGIISSTSDGSQIHALFDNALVGAASWNGQSIAPNAVVGKYTYFGDMNLDGQVTGDDYTAIDANLNTDPAVGVEWTSGDANLDGVVTGDDYTVIDANLGLGVGNPLTPNALNAVPEPSSLLVVLGAAGGLLARRRRAM